MGNQFGCEPGPRHRSPGQGGPKQSPRGSKKIMGLLEDMEKCLVEEQAAQSEAPPKPKVGASIQQFNQQMELAIRTATMCVICALPIIVPSWYQYLLDSGISSGWISNIPGGTILMVVFTVYKTLGGTVQLFWQGAIGTFWACAFSHVMSALMPLGAFGDHYSATVMNIANCLFVFLALWLNLGTGVRNFILSYHVYFVMALQDPSTDPQMNLTWAIDFNSTTVQTLVTAVAGCAGAVLVMLVPYPITATRRAGEAASAATTQLCDVMDDLLAYFRREKPSVVITHLESEATDLCSTVQNLQGDIDASWWENFDLGRAGRTRNLLSSHATLLTTLADNVSAMQMCISKEDFGRTHTTAMKRMSETQSFQSLLNATRQLAMKAVESVRDGSLDQKERAELTALMKPVTDALSSMATSFNDMRQDKSLFHKVSVTQDVVNEDLQAESFFVYCLSIHARTILTYTTEILNENKGTPDPLQTQIWEAWVSVFDPEQLKSRLYLRSFTVRSTIQVLVAYYLGMYGFAYNAVAAGTLSLLLSEFVGSAMIKNLNRLQAVALSAIVPHLLCVAQGYSCDPSMAILKGLIIFLWETLTLYVYYSSPTLGYMGCLIAGFAPGTLVFACTHHESLDPQELNASLMAYDISSYNKILQVTIAVIIMIIVDSILSPGRASSQSRGEICKSLMGIDMWLQATFMKRSPERRGSVSDQAGLRAFEERTQLKKHVGNDEELTKLIMEEDKETDTINEFYEECEKILEGQAKNVSGMIVKHLANAQLLSSEANQEPRYHRGPWPVDFASEVLKTATSLQQNLTIIEQVLEGCGPTSYEDIFEGSDQGVAWNIRRLPSWTAAQAKIVESMKHALLLVRQVLNNETNAPQVKIVTAALKKSSGNNFHDDLEILFKEINRDSGLRFPPPGTKLDNLEQDVICRVNVMLMLLDACSMEIENLVKIVLRNIN